MFKKIDTKYHSDRAKLLKNPALNFCFLISKFIRTALILFLRKNILVTVSNFPVSIQTKLLEQWTMKIKYRTKQIISIHVLFLMLFLSISFLLYGNAFAQNKIITNGIIIISSGSTSSANDVEKYIKHQRGKITHSFPPYVIMGQIPTNLDAKLRTEYGVAVYRNRVDLSIVEKYGELAISAVTIWNNNFAKQPLSIPVILLPRKEQITRLDKMVFRWEECPGASHYRVQISTSQSFSFPCLDAIVNKSHYTFHSAFLDEGLYYWRVCALDLLNRERGEVRESGWSEVGSFQISKREERKNILGIREKILPVAQEMKGKQPLKWEKIPEAKYYRIQISSSPLFDYLLVDEVTEKPYYKTTNSALQFGNTYYWRIMVTDGSITSHWSNVGTLIVDFPEPIVGDALHEPPQKEK